MSASVSRSGPGLVLAARAGSGGARAAASAAPAAVPFGALPPAELLAFLLARPTVPDAAWLGRFFGAPDAWPARARGESRAAFAARVLGPGGLVAGA